MPLTTLHNNPILIAGMHRSGTTLVARLLQSMGVFLGRRLDDHHEALAFMELNDRALGRAHAAWDRPLGIEDLFAHPVLMDAVAGNLRAATKTTAFSRSYLGPAHLFRRASRTPWGFKDPRTTVTWPLWKRVFPGARMVVVRRHGVDVAASLHRRSAALLAPGRAARLARTDHMARFASIRCASLARAYALWRETEALYRRLLEQHPAPPVIEILFEELIANPRPVLQRVADHLELSPGPAQWAGATRMVRAERAFAYRTDPALMAFAREWADDPALDAWRGIATAPHAAGIPRR